MYSVSSWMHHDGYGSTLPLQLARQALQQVPISARDEIDPSCDRGKTWPRRANAFAARRGNCGSMRRPWLRRACRPRRCGLGCRHARRSSTPSVRWIGTRSFLGSSPICVAPSTWSGRTNWQIDTYRESCTDSASAQPPRRRACPRRMSLQVA